MVDGLSFDQIEQQQGQAQAAPPAPAVAMPAPQPNVSPKASEPGIAFEDLEKQAPGPASSPKASGISFEDLEKQGHSISDSPTIQALNKTAYGNSGGLPQAISDLPETIRHSAVGALLDKLQAPENLVAAGVVKGLDSTVSPGIEAKLNPKGQWFPDLAYSDVADYFMPSATDFQKNMQDQGYPEPVSKAVSGLYWASKTSLGLAMNYFGDPLIAMSPTAGQRTANALELYKSGDVASEAANERNLLTVNKPFSNSTMLEIPAKPVTDAIQGAAQATADGIRSIPGGQTALTAGQKAAQVAKRVVQALDYKTGDPDIDFRFSIHTGVKRGDMGYIQSNFVEPLQKLGLTEGETKVLRDTIEATPNILPNVAQQHLGGVKGFQQDEIPLLRDQLRDVIPQAAERAGVTLPQSRIDDLADAVIRIKQENATDIEERIAAGLLDPRDLKQKVIENYLVHKMNPVYRTWGPEAATAATEQALVADVVRSTRGSSVSSFDNAQYGRTLRGSVSDLNEQIEAAKGYKNFFIDDPIVATAMKRAETRKLIRDKELLDYLQTRGTIAAGKQARQLEAQGYSELKAPQFQDQYKGIYFPNQVADKINYYIQPRQVGSIAGYMDSYNRVLRNFALTDPGYYARNWTDNLAKNFIQGVKIEDYTDAMKVMANKEGDFITTAKGEKIPVSRVREQMDQLGIRTGGQFKEGLENVLFTGKKVMQDQNLATRTLLQAKATPGKILNGMREMGENGENYTRMGLYLNRVKQGYAPEVAALEVEKFLFDYSRTSKATDWVRRLYDPFIQHALKTAEIFPSLLGKSSGKVNFMQNSFYRTMQNSMNDPATVSDVMAILPEYRKIHDPVLGPLLPGNHWLVAAMGQGDPSGRAAVLFNKPFSTELMDKFAIWRPETLQRIQGMPAPAIRIASIGALGYDPFSGQNIDITRNAPDFARRLNATVTAAVEGATPMPNLYKAMKQRLGIGNPDYYKPESLLMLQGAMGQFGQVVNLDKEFTSRQGAFIAIRKQLMDQLKSTYAAEVKGNTADQALGTGLMGTVGNKLLGKNYNSAEVYAALLGNQADLEKAGARLQHLKGQMTTPELAGYIKNLDETIAQANDAYVTARKQAIQVGSQIKDERFKQMMTQPAPTPSPARSPQSVSSGPSRSPASDEEEADDDSGGDMHLEDVHPIFKGMSQDDSDNWLHEAEGRVGSRLTSDDILYLTRNGRNKTFSDARADKLYDQKVQEMKEDLGREPKDDDELWDFHDLMANRGEPQNKAQDALAEELDRVENQRQSEQAGSDPGAFRQREDHNDVTREQPNSSDRAQSAKIDSTPVKNNETGSGRKYDVYLNSKIDPKTGKRTWQMGQKFKD